MSASRATKQTRAIVPHVGRIIRASRAGKYRCNAMPIRWLLRISGPRARPVHRGRCALHCSAFLSMWHRVDARYVPYGDLANHTFVEPSAASGIVCSLWWGQFASRFCVSCGRCVCARARDTYTRAIRVVRARLPGWRSPPPLCMYARARTREPAYVISDPGGDPGIRSHHTGLSTPTTVHHRQRGAPLCAPNDTRPVRETLSQAAASLLTLWGMYCVDSMRFYLVDVNRIPWNWAFLQINEWFWSFVFDHFLLA